MKKKEKEQEGIDMGMAMPNRGTDRRLHARSSVEKLECFIMDKKEKKETSHKVLNVSLGGMLLMKDDDDVFSVGDKKEIRLLFNKEGQGTIFHGEVIRLQDKSVAIKFKKTNKEQEAFLKQIR